MTHDEHAIKTNTLQMFVTAAIAVLISKPGVLKCLLVLKVETQR